MNLLFTREKERLAKPVEMRFKKKQAPALSVIAEDNNEVPIALVVRTFVDYGIKLTRLNGGQLPLIDQVRLQRMLVRKAARDRKRSKR